MVPPASRYYSMDEVALFMASCLNHGWRQARAGGGDLGWRGLKEWRASTRRLPRSARLNVFVVAKTAAWEQPSGSHEVCAWISVRQKQKPHGTKKKRLESVAGRVKPLETRDC